MLESLFSFLVDWIEWLGLMIFHSISSAWADVMLLLHPLWLWSKEIFCGGLEWLWDTIVSILPAVWWSALGPLGPAWSWFVSMVDQVNWVLPIYGLFDIWLAAIGIVVVIRIVRWVKSFLPTISDG